MAEVCVYGKINFLDDNYSNAIGKTDQIDKLAGEYDSVIVSIGNSEIRRDLILRLRSINAPLVSLVHPIAFVSPPALVGIGSIVFPEAIIPTNASVGIACIISIGVLLDHNAVIEDFSHINTGAIARSGKRSSVTICAVAIV